MKMHMLDVGVGIGAIVLDAMCGTSSTRTSIFTNIWENVTCKNCLRPCYRPPKNRRREAVMATRRKQQCYVD